MLRRRPSEITGEGRKLKMSDCKTNFEITLDGLSMWSVDATLFEYLQFAFCPKHQTNPEYVWFWHHSVIISSRGMEIHSRSPIRVRKREDSEKAELPSKNEVIWALRHLDSDSIEEMAKASNILRPLSAHPEWSSAKVLHRCPLCGYETTATNLHRYCPENPTEHPVPMYVVEKRAGSSGNE